MFNYEDTSKQLFSSNEMLNKSFQQIFPETAANNFSLSKSQMIHLRESPQARARRLARNAERMREKRAKENFDEYRARLDRNALNNRQKRHNENPTEKAMRQVRDAARQRLRRAMETDDKRSQRLTKLAERMRTIRQNETHDQRVDRLAKAAKRARERLLRETDDERKERLKKSSEYARRLRASKCSSVKSEPDLDGSDIDDDMEIKREKSPEPLQMPQTPHNYEMHQHQSIEHHQHQQIELQNPQIYQHQLIQQPQINHNVLNIPSLPNSSNLTHTPSYSNNKMNLDHLLSGPTNSRIHQYIPNLSYSIPATYPYSNSSAHNFASQQPINQSINQSIQEMQHQHNNGININLPSNHSTNHLATINVPQYHNLLSMPPQKIHEKSNGSASGSSSSNSSTSFQELSPVSSLGSLGSQFSNENRLNLNKTRGRPRKVPESEWMTEGEKIEFQRQKKMEVLLEQEINNMLTSPRKPRGRPQRGNETDEHRQERLRKMAELSRMRRANETEEQRKQRLKSLQERAKLRRDIVKTTENSEQRKERLAKQADYARTRRIKMNTMEGKQHMEKRARELYARIHKSPEKSLEEIEKNMKSEQISVLKILEPIIEMSTN